MTDANKMSTRSNSTTGESSNDDRIIKMLREMNAKIDLNHKQLTKKVDEQKLCLREELNSTLSNFEQRIHSQISSSFQQQSLRIDVLEDKFHHQDRISKLEDIIIKGLPKMEKEDLLDTFAKIGLKIDFNHSIYSAVKNIIRIAAKSSSSTNQHHAQITSSVVLVTFVSQILKRDFMNKYFMHLNINLGDIGHSSTDRIFIVDNLTKANNLIQRQAHSLKVNGQIDKIQIRSGFVYVKYVGASNFAKIVNTNQLPNLVARINTSNGYVNNNIGNIALAP